MPPRSWLRAVRAFRARPTSKTPTMRLTRTIPSSWSTRTSAKLGAEGVHRVALRFRAWRGRRARLHVRAALADQQALEALTLAEDAGVEDPSVLDADGVGGRAVEGARGVADGQAHQLGTERADRLVHGGAGAGCGLGAPR
jgi:hypothetical protein